MVFLMKCYNRNIIIILFKLKLSTVKDNEFICRDKITK